MRSIVNKLAVVLLGAVKPDDGGDGLVSGTDVDAQEVMGIAGTDADNADWLGCTFSVF